MNEIDNLYNKKQIIDEKYNKEKNRHYKYVVVVIAFICTICFAFFCYLLFMQKKYERQELYSEAARFCTDGRLVRSLYDQTIYIDEPYKEMFNTDYGTYFTFPFDEKSCSYIEVTDCNVIEANRVGDSFSGYKTYIKADVVIEIPLKIDNEYYNFIVTGGPVSRFSTK